MAYNSNYTTMSELEEIFNQLVEKKFFDTWTIRPFFHNRQITNINLNPISVAKDRWDYGIGGYRLMGGRMGNPDTYVRFKRRGYKLIVLRYDTDNYNDSTYLGTINLIKAGVLTPSVVQNYREKQLKTLLDGNEV